MKNEDSDLNQEKIKEALVKACEKLKQEDQYLLCSDVNERSITHRLAVYLEKEISEYKDWSVDCEYNRIANGKAITRETKKLLSFEPKPKPESGYDIDARTVFPDIIVHRRGVPGQEDGNLLVIEAKKSTLSSENDKEKLRAYCTDLNYLSAALVIFEVGKRKSAEESASKEVRILWLDPKTREFEND